MCEYELDLYANFGHKQRVRNKGPHAGLALPDPTTNNLPSKQPKHSCSQAKRCTRFWTTCMRRSPQPASGLFTISSPNTFSQKRTFALTVAKPGLGTKLEESQHIWRRGDACVRRPTSKHSCKPPWPNPSRYCRDPHPSNICKPPGPYSCSEQAPAVTEQFAQDHDLALTSCLASFENADLPAAVLARTHLPLSPLDLGGLGFTGPFASLS